MTIDDGSEPPIDFVAHFSAKTFASDHSVLPHSKRRSTISSAGITNSNLWSAEI